MVFTSNNSFLFLSILQTFFIPPCSCPHSTPQANTPSDLLTFLHPFFQSGLCPFSSQATSSEAAAQTLVIWQSQSKIPLGSAEHPQPGRQALLLPHAASPGCVAHQTASTADWHPLGVTSSKQQPFSLRQPGSCNVAANLFTTVLIPMRCAKGRSQPFLTIL